MNASQGTVYNLHSRGPFLGWYGCTGGGGSRVMFVVLNPVGPKPEKIS